MLQAMSGRDREVLTLIVWDELSREQVAASLGITVEAVQQEGTSVPSRASSGPFGSRARDLPLPRKGGET